MCAHLSPLFHDGCFVQVFRSQDKVKGMEFHGLELTKCIVSFHFAALFHIDILFIAVGKASFRSKKTIIGK